MVIKSISHTGARKSDFRRILNYICDVEKTGNKPVLLKQFVSGYGDIEKYVEDFYRNDSSRSYSYGKKRVSLLHEILSFSPKDAPLITREKLHSFAEEYIKLRAPENLVVASVHIDENPHIHFVISNTRIDGTSSRLTIKEFKKIKEAMTEFQLKHFPELIHSLPDHSSKKKVELTAREKSLCDSMESKLKSSSLKTH